MGMTQQGRVYGHGTAGKGLWASESREGSMGMRQQGRFYRHETAGKGLWMRQLKKCWTKI